jgi:hypothetical protein
MKARLVSGVVLATAFAIALTAAPRASADPLNGDFVHIPATEQQVNTPLPVYVEYAGSLGRVVIKYAGQGQKTWSRVEMKRVGAGWGGLVPCNALSAGVVRYWIQGFDESDEAVANSGDPKHPYVVPIRETITSKPPHLPGRGAPETCTDQPTEPPAEAAAAPPPRRPKDAPEHDEDETPVEPARRAAGEGAFARWWVGVSGAADVVSVPGGVDLCKLTSSGIPANTTGEYCTNPDGTDFPSRASSGRTMNGALVKGAAGQLPGGIVAGDLRAMIAVDYAVTPSILVGGRLGYVLDAYPTAGAAVTDHHAFGAHAHVEARVTYVFGDDPLVRVGFAPAVFAAAGVAAFDGHEASIVSYTTTANHPTVNQPVDVWRTGGPWFLALGGGARYQFSPRTAFTLLARANAAFGGVGALFTFGPEIGFQYGF